MKVTIVALVLMDAATFLSCSNGSGVASANLTGQWVSTSDASATQNLYFAANGKLAVYPTLGATASCMADGLASCGCGTYSVNAGVLDLTLAYQETFYTTYDCPYFMTLSGNALHLVWASETGPPWPFPPTTC